MQLDLFRPEDADAVFRIIQENYQTVLAPFYSPEAIAHSLMSYHTPSRLREAAEKARATYVARDGTDLKGTGQLTWREDTKERLFIGRVYVDVRAHGQGVGQLLMAGLEAVAKKEAEEVWLYAVIHPRTVEFYQKQGYEILEHKNFPLPQGGVFPCELMVKKL